MTPHAHLSQPSAKPQRSTILLTLVALALLGVVLIGAIGWNMERTMRSEWLKRAELMAAMLDPVEVAELTATPDDLERPVFRRLQAALARMRATAPNLRYVYLLRSQPAGPPVFLLDVQNDALEDSPPTMPGELYPEATPELLSVFGATQGLVEGPVGDRWGLWVSALAPLPRAGVAGSDNLIGLDVDARNWYWILAARATPAAGLTMTVLIGAIILMFLWRAREQAKRELIQERQRLAGIVGERMRLAAEAARFGVWDYDISRDRLDWDSWMFQLYGADPETFSGNFEAWRNTLLPEDRESAAAQVEAAIREGGDLENEFRVRWPNGEIRRLCGAAQIIRDDQNRPVRITGINYDITDRWRAEQAVRASADLLKKLSQQLPGVIYQYRRLPDGRSCFPFASEHIREIYEVTPEQVHDDATPVFERLHPDDRARVEASIRDSFEHLSRWECEYRVKLPTRGERWLRGSANPERLKGGSVLWHGYIADITNSKNIEQALREANSALEAAIRHANALTDQAESANRAKSEFLANMSHEIRTPMNGVIGMTSLLLETPLSEQQRQYGEIIRSSGESLLSVINDILDFSKIEAGKLQLEQIDFDVLELLDDFATVFAFRAHEKALKFVCDPAPEVPTRLRGDPGRLRQILTNLTGNAIKFTEAGEISIGVRLADHQPEALATSGGPAVARLRFTVSDTGIGIPTADLDRLFQKFTQVDASTTRRFGGTGLGLAIARQLTELMHGDIGVISTPDQGSTFWFEMNFECPPTDKLAPPQGASAEAPDHKPPPRRLPADQQRACILLAEDNSINQQVAQSLTDVKEPEEAVFDSQDLLTRLMGDVALAHDVVQVFIEDLTEQTTTLRAQLDAAPSDPSSDPSDSAHQRDRLCLTHGIAGACANVSAKRLGALCKDIEQALRNHDTNQAREFAKRLPGEVEHLREAIMAFIRAAF